MDSLLKSLDAGNSVVLVCFFKGMEEHTGIAIDSIPLQVVAKVVSRSGGFC